MPELPEVETVRRGLTSLILGRRIAAVEVLKPKSFPREPGDLAHVVGARVSGIRRYAKLLAIDLDTGWSLVAHLKMTGQMVFRDDHDTEVWGAGHPTASFLSHLPDNSTRVIFHLTDKTAPSPGLCDSAVEPDDGTVGGPVAPVGGAVGVGVSPADSPYHLFFNDQRIFGWVRAIPSEQVEELDFVAKLGPEPLTPDGEQLTGALAKRAETEYLSRVRRRAGSAVKAAILDQTVIAGVGNIYADEALWSAKVHPATRVRDLTDTQLRSIFRSAGLAMWQSLAAGGSTMRDYIQADGTPGSYLDKFANVFRREGQPCPRCGAAIEKTRVAGRGTHVCPRCQRPPRTDSDFHIG